MFVNCQLAGMDFAFPDVCMTPVVTPTPIPYPNMAMASTAKPSQYVVLISCMPAHTLATQKQMTSGDQAGVNMGVASGQVMGPSRHMMCSFKVFYGGSPVTRMLDMTGQNGTSPNMVGLSLTPSQYRLMVMS